MREWLGNSCRTNGISVPRRVYICAAEKGPLCCDIVIHSKYRGRYPPAYTQSAKLCIPSCERGAKCNPGHFPCRELNNSKKFVCTCNSPDLDLAAYKNSWMHNFPLVCGKSSLILFKVLLPSSQMAWNYQKRVPRRIMQRQFILTRRP